MASRTTLAFPVRGRRAKRIFWTTPIFKVSGPRVRDRASWAPRSAVEAIAEFSLLTNTYSAQFGGNGAVVNAVSKSGTNSFHGSGVRIRAQQRIGRPPTSLMARVCS